MLGECELSQNTLLYFTHPSCDDVGWQNAYGVRWSEENDAGVVR